MPELTESRPGARADRQAFWDRWRQAVTNGHALGTGGADRPLLRAYALIAAFVGLVDLVNVTTILHDSARRGDAVPTWKPFTWEFTSGAAELAVCLVIYVALRRAPPGQAPWWRFLPVHAAASLAFSFGHVIVMTVLRLGIYTLMDARYPLSSADFLYEYRKDVVSYAVLAGIFWMVAGPSPSKATAPAAKLPAGSFDILDGSRTLRVSVTDILLVRAAGNYVEFLLSDGRKPLMRTTLAQIGATLAPSGFVRTHRSWIVNRARIKVMQPVGSGDFSVVMDTGDEAPMSRRFRWALV